MDNVAVTIVATNAQRHLHECRFLFPSLPETMIQFETDMLLPDLRLPQDYISRYISHETQMRGSQHLHDFITSHNQAWRGQRTQDSFTPHGHFLHDRAHTMLEDPVNDALDLPDLVSEDSSDDLSEQIAQDV